MEAFSTNISQFQIPISTSNSSKMSSLPYNTRQQLAIVFIILICFGFLSNLGVLFYIIINRLYRNFVSSHFIAHLSLTNIIGCCYLLPMFVVNLMLGHDIFEDYGGLCRMQAFFACALWSVVYYMTTCVAGVHLLTFARIHYDQLFGLPPSVICLLSWVIGVALGLPCITNGDIVQYDPMYYQCLWGHTTNGYKFLAYMLLLGVVLPLSLTLYAYVRVLGIFYHSPVVFQALGLYKSRFLVYGLICTPLCQMPFYVARFLPHLHPVAYPLVMFVAYLFCVADATLYGVSLFLMKEEDMALTARAHKEATTYGIPGIKHPQEL